MYLIQIIVFKKPLWGKSIKYVCINLFFWLFVSGILDRCSLSGGGRLREALHEKLDLHKFTQCKYGAKKCKLVGN